VSDGSGDSIEVLELWFGETVGCCATFKFGSKMLNFCRESSSSCV